MHSGDRLKELLRLLDISQKEFAQTIDKTAANLSSYISNRRKLSAPLARKIVEKYPRVNIEWLLLGVGDPFSNVKIPQESVPQNIMRLPIYANIACGSPATIFQDEPLDYYTMDKIKSLRNPIILKAKGDSNYPDIHDGDLILATEIDRPKKGDLVATNFRGASPGLLNTNMKVYQPTKQKDTFLLKPLNSSYEITIHQFNEVYNFYKCIQLVYRELKNF